MQRGANVGEKLKALARERGISQAQLEQRTGIGHSTMSGYWSGRLALGLANGRRIASALDVELTDLGLSEVEEAASEVTELRLVLSTLEESVRLLTERVAALEPKPRAPRRAAATRKRKAV